MARIAVVGAGAIGQFYAAQFILAGHDVRLIARRDLAALRSCGLRLVQEPTPHIASTATHRELTIPPSDFRACATGSEAAEGGVDWCLLAIKTTGLGDAASLAGPLVEAGAGVVAMMNGLGIEDACARWCPPERVWGMLCYTCVNRDDDGLVRHLAHGMVGVGHYCDDPGERARLGALCEGAGIVCMQPPCLLEARWRKLAWNIPFNGLSVAGGGAGHSTRDILADPVRRRRCEVVMRETIRLGNADLVAHDRLERIDEDAWTAKQLGLTVELGDYLTSTLLDWRAGRTMELDAMFHEPLRRARALGVAVPELERLVAELPA